MTKSELADLRIGDELFTTLWDAQGEVLVVKAINGPKDAKYTLVGRIGSELAFWLSNEDLLSDWWVLAAGTKAGKVFDKELEELLNDGN